MSPVVHPQRLLSAAVLTIGVIASAAAADQYSLDPVHTEAIYRVSHIGISNQYGRFNEVSGSITFDPANPAADAVEITVQAASVDTHAEKRDQHLKGPDFFDVKQFPTLGFKSTAWKSVDGKSFEVAGNFTMHGVTKPLTVTVTKTGEGKDPWGGYRIGFESVFTIKRSDYGMTGMAGAVGDEVQIILTTEGVRK